MYVARDGRRSVLLARVRVMETFACRYGGLERRFVRGGGRVVESVRFRVRVVIAMIRYGLL